MTEIIVWAVEDDEDDTLLLHTAIQETMRQVNFTSFSDGRSFLQHINRENITVPSIIFVDAHLNGYTGLDCLQQIKSLTAYAATKVVLMSTHVKETSIQELYANGAYKYITKPNDYQQLVTLMQELFADLSTSTASVLR